MVCGLILRLNFELIMSRSQPTKINEFISIKGARVHNLKNISLNLPRNKFIVITGVSGSGKSSLAIDTIFAEGQRRYLESLSSYARQFLQRKAKPDVDKITGLSPVIAIDQKTNNFSSLSTVGTMTEIYSYLQILFAKIGKIFSPITQQEIRKYKVQDILDYIINLPKSGYILITYPYSADNFHPQKRNTTLQILSAKMLTRAILPNGQIMRLEQISDDIVGELLLIVDRVNLIDPVESLTARLRNSLEIAMYEGQERISVVIEEGENKVRIQEFSNHNDDNVEYLLPSESLFSFNNALGACKNCMGTGMAYFYDRKLIFPNPKLSIANGAIAPWNGVKMSQYLNKLLAIAAEIDIPIHKPIEQFSSEQLDCLWYGNALFPGIIKTFQQWEKEQYKIQYRSLLARYRTYGMCPKCQGNRLCQEAFYIQVQGKNIGDIINMRIDKLHDWIENLELSSSEQVICHRVCQEILQRTNTLCKVGLHYLTLNRSTNSLSGGEGQRVRLTLSLGNALTDSIYILDEPSIGLHPRDTHRLIEVIRELCNLNNTVIVIEHDEQIMQNADFLVDIGPLASHLGGEIVFAGCYSNLLSCTTSLTANYLHGDNQTIYTRVLKDKPQSFIHIREVNVKNLQNVEVKFPLYRFSVVTGISGSGKSSLITEALYTSLNAILNGQKSDFPITIDNPQAFSTVTLIDQNSLTASSRSTPISYIGVFKLIRELFARQHLSKERDYKAQHFSYNSNIGSCERCEGMGIENIDMLFMADIQLPCELCQGKRYKEQILEVCYKGKNIYDILQLSVTEALEFFAEQKVISKYLQSLDEVGLGYMQLGQSAKTMSGGEIQRVKLASYLNLSTNQRELLIFDEPTTGLHFHDIQKLLKSFNKLISLGHTIICIEHNTMLIREADWIIELGPGAAEDGGTIIYSGPMDNIFQQKNSLIASYLKGNSPI